MHLIKLAIPKPTLAEFASSRSLSARLTTDYLVHSVLSETFSETPRPFVAEDKGRLLRVLFYSDYPYSKSNETDLQDRAQFGASPEAYEAISWDQGAGKPIPDSVPEGMDLKFETKASPVVEKASSGKGKNVDGEPRTWEEGDELDVFLSRQWKSEKELSRFAVYKDWLSGRIEGHGASVESIAVEGFNLKEMTRRTRGGDRKVTAFKRPVATMSGKAKVTGPVEFGNLLRKGVGKHKSFGYGFLKIRPA
jgi:CRISPR system Cascade subunit CasE